LGRACAGQPTRYDGREDLTRSASMWEAAVRIMNSNTKSIWLAAVMAVAAVLSGSATPTQLIRGG
jgi:hypothetical protein